MLIVQGLGFDSSGFRVRLFRVQGLEASEHWSWLPVSVVALLRGFDKQVTRRVR